MNTYKKTKEVCKTFVRGFDEIEQHIMAWGKGQKRVQKDLRSLLALNDDERYPERYGSRSAGNYLLSLVLTEPKTIRKLASKHEAVLTATAKQVLSFWQESPAFWSFFAITEVLQDDFLMIEDLLVGEEHLLYSPGVSSMQKNGETRNKHYLALMMPNGECLQTAGIIRFNSLSGSDLNFYCDLFDSDEDLTAIVNKHYTEFFLLDEISALPPIGHKGHTVLYVWQGFTLEEFSVETLGGQWAIENRASMSQFALEVPSDSMRGLPNGELLFSDYPMMGSTIYRNNDTKVMGLTTNTEASYTIFQALLNQKYPQLSLPDEPDIAISVSLLSLVDRMGVALPWTEFKDVRDFDIGVDEDLDTTNMLLEAYMMAKNTGQDFDPKAFGKRSGMAMEDIKGIIGAVEQHAAKTMPSYGAEPKDKQYELSGWPVPPAITRRLFFDGLRQSGLFTLDEGPNAYFAFASLTGGSYKEELSKVDLVDFVETMFIDYFGDDLAYVLMNAFFWILFFMGDTWLPVRSYAIEILKLFPHILDTAYPNGEAFISDFSLFTKKMLCSRGICSLKARPKAAEVATGLYAIKGSDVFYSLVERPNG